VRREVAFFQVDDFLLFDRLSLSWQNNEKGSSKDKQHCLGRKHSNSPGAGGKKKIDT
jgi:hypothetical protein